MLLTDLRRNSTREQESFPHDEGLVCAGKSKTNFFLWINVAAGMGNESIDEAKNNYCDYDDFTPRPISIAAFHANECSQPN